MQQYPEKGDDLDSRKLKHQPKKQPRLLHTCYSSIFQTLQPRRQKHPKREDTILTATDRNGNQPKYSHNFSVRTLWLKKWGKKWQHPRRDETISIDSSKPEPAENEWPLLLHIYGVYIYHKYFKSKYNRPPTARQHHPKERIRSRQKQKPNPNTATTSPHMAKWRTITASRGQHPRRGDDLDRQKPKPAENQRQQQQLADCWILWILLLPQFYRPTTTVVFENRTADFPETIVRREAITTALPKLTHRPQVGGIFNRFSLKTWDLADQVQERIENKDRPVGDWNKDNCRDRCTRQWCTGLFSPRSPGR